MSGAGPRRWGFHQLNPLWANRLVEAAGIKAGQFVVDLGAGRGVLSVAAADAGAKVLAVELHPKRLIRLRQLGQNRNITVLECDLEQFRAPAKPFFVIANPPFALTTTTIHRITGRGSGLRRADLVLPVPLARQWLNRRLPGYQCELGMRVPAGAFRPAATRGCVVLVIRRR